MKVICCQTDIIWARKEENFRRVEGLLSAHARDFGGLIVLPEMFATGFVLGEPEMAELPEVGPTIDFLARVAESTGSHILAGLLVRREAGTSNDAILVAPDGSVAGQYSKIHPFSPAGESEGITAGGQVTLLRLGEWTISPFICYDLRFPEIFRLASPSTDLFVVIANWPAQRESHWVSLLKARAIENQAYVVGVNRTGDDPNLAYGGRSLIIDPLGMVLEDAGAGEGCIATDLDHSLVQQWRSDFPAQQDRRDMGTIRLGIP